MCGGPGEVFRTDGGVPRVEATAATGLISANYVCRQWCMVGMWACVGTVEFGPVPVSRCKVASSAPRAAAVAATDFLYAFYPVHHGLELVGNGGVGGDTWRIMCRRD